MNNFVINTQSNNSSVQLGTGEQGKIFLFRPVEPPGLVDLFNMNYSLAAAPGAGWVEGPNIQSPDELTITRVSGQGPSGEDVYRLTFAHQPHPSGQFGLGWGTTFEGTPFTYGDEVYLRFRYRINAGAVLRFYDDEGGLSGVGRLKFIILNDAASSVTSRPILDIQMYRNDGITQLTNWRICKGGGVDPDQTSDVALDSAWHALQLRIRYSSAENVSDGGYDVWLDNSTEGSPDATVSNIIMNADLDPGSVKLGAYINNGLYTDGVLVIDQTGFAISETFTSGWV